LAPTGTQKAEIDEQKFLYNGQEVDRQLHFGYDFADNYHSKVRAANRGRVIFASDLGVYGGCIVIDHGLGLQSVYGQLSSIRVRLNQVVNRGDLIGRTGRTGLAIGRDHLHFALQLDGVPINGTEWWDSNWTKTHIVRKVPDL
jgi:murein DD-endopeptidase MepM/ murein hydrolase activator NlpD